MSARLMARTFEVDVERTDSGGVKGAPLQSKINGFTKGKKITRVHDVLVLPASDKVRALLTYDENRADDAPPTLRIFSKTIHEAAVDTGLQTAVNSFSSGKDINVVATSAGLDADGKATVVILYTKPGVTSDQGGGGEGEESSSESAQEPEPAAA